MTAKAINILTIRPTLGASGIPAGAEAFLLSRKTRGRGSDQREARALLEKVYDDLPMNRDHDAIFIGTKRAARAAYFNFSFLFPLFLVDLQRDHVDHIGKPVQKGVALICYLFFPEQRSCGPFSPSCYRPCRCSAAPQEESPGLTANMRLLYRCRHP